MNWKFSEDYTVDGLFIPKGTPIDEITNTGVIKFHLNGIAHQVQG